jgi:hypothetical protein
LKHEKKKKPSNQKISFTLASALQNAPATNALGEGLLEFLAEKHGRTKIGKSAKNKLKLLAV